MKIKLVSYKEVMAKLEQSSTMNKEIFAKGGMRVDFHVKAETLSCFGFSNSITQRMYKDIANSTHLFQEYAFYYPHAIFLLDSQLETVYEDFNLFERPTHLYMGVIPEPNVRDLMNFKFRICDLNLTATELERLKSVNSFANINCDDRTFISWSYFATTICNSRSEKLLMEFAEKFISIAAVKGMFHESAFGPKYGTGRIPKKPEIETKAQVETDPIVILKVRGGNLVITAWGEESNHDFIINPKQN